MIQNTASILPNTPSMIQNEASMLRNGHFGDLSGPGQRRREPRNRRRQLLGMRARHILQLPRQHGVDRRLIPLGEPPQHLALIPRNARMQLDQPNRLRQHRRRLVAKRFFDGGGEIPTISSLLPLPKPKRASTSPENDDAPAIRSRLAAHQATFERYGLKAPYLTVVDITSKRLHRLVQESERLMRPSNFDPDRTLTIAG